MKTEAQKKRRFRIYSAIVGFFSLLLAVGIATSNINFSSKLLAGGQSNYSLTLNSSNKVTASGEYTQNTDIGKYGVKFSYTSVGTYSSGHVTLNSGGTITNKDHIRSITSINATYTGGTLSFKSSYGGDVWNTAADITSGQTYDLGSDPYYLMFTASGSVTIESIVINFSCQENPSAHEGETGGSSYYSKISSTADLSNGDYLIVFEGNDNVTARAFDGSLDTLDAIDNVFDVTIENETIASNSSIDSKAFTITSISGGYSIQSKSGWFIGQTTDGNGLKTSSSAYTNTISFYSDGDANITCSSAHLMYNPTSNQNRFRYFRSSTYTNQEYLTLYQKTDGSIPYDQPDPFVTGFTVSFNNNLNEDSIFDNDGNVVVTKQMSNGSSGTLSSGYTVQVLNASTRKPIDTSVAFGYDPRQGGNDYILHVEYGSFLPYESNFSVGQNNYVSEIESTFDVIGQTINTATTLNDLISNYSVSLSFRRGNPVTGITYSNFSNYSEYGLALTLLDPSGVTHSISSAFGTAGTWTLRTTTTKNVCVDESTFEVSAIPVTQITVGGTLEVEEGKTTQLTLGVQPENATNKLVNWVSADTAIAIVSNSGLVTGVSAGSTTITATAKDGSGVYGSVTVEVTERTSNPFTRVTSSSLTDGSYVIFATASSGSARFMAGQNTNNRATVTGTISNNQVQELPSGAYEFKVTKNSDNTYSFYDSVNEGYLAATSSSSNNLGTISSITGNSKFSYTNASGDDIEAQGTYTRNRMRVNGEIISLYGSTTGLTAKPYLFERSGAAIYPTSISLSGDSGVSVGSTTTISVTYNPTGTTVKNVTWRSSDTSVATVANGIVTGVKAGTATIYAKAATKTGFTAEVSKQITVSNVAVQSVSLNKTSGTLRVDETVTLIPTISPSNATNKAVTWSTSNSSVATVSDGLVTAKTPGSATITVTTSDGGKTAQYNLTVVTSGGGSGGSGGAEWTLVEDASTLTAGDVIVIGSYDKGVVAGSLSSQILSSVSSGVTYESSSKISELPDTALQLTLGGQSGAWTLSNSDGQLLGATSNKKLAWDSGTTTWDISIVSGGATIQNTTDTYGRFLYNSDSPRFTTYTSAVSSTMILPEIYIGGSAEPVDPTGISLSPTSVDLYAGQYTNVTATILPKGANQNKTITWSSSNPNVTVDSTGKVTVSQEASPNQSATITAKLNDAPNKPQATMTVNVVETQLDEWTILVYMSGSNLESDNGFASGDIQEMMEMRNKQPSNMNIVIQTGGSTKWKKYNISASKIGRYELEPGKTSPTLIEQNTQQNMGNSTTLQEFIEWGVTKYPAQKTGLIFWNHGGALDGCCWDDNYGQNGDPLTNKECKTAFANAFSRLGRTEPFEWVGYDCCLMQVQDIAEFNSPYFNYMVASQELESGYGWDYDTWLKVMYEGGTTVEVLSSICDSFIAEQGYSSDQTLSVLDLTKMAAYKSAWETMASAISSSYITSSSNFSTLKTYVNKAHKYGYDSDYDTSVNNNGYVYDVFNVSEVLSQFKSHYSNCNTQITNAQTALNNLIVHNVCGSQAGNSCGLCCFFPISQYGTSSYYSTSITNFTNWRSLCFKY